MPAAYPPIALALVALLVLNAATFAAFAWDKRQARRGEWRVSENTLMGLALLGGWPGAKLGQRLLRHKTRKEPFRTMLNTIPLAWVVAGAVTAWVYA